MTLLDQPTPHRKPKRIQRKRTKGYRLPPGAVYVGRPTRWGNPHPASRLDLHGQPIGRAYAVELFRISTIGFRDLLVESGASPDEIAEAYEWTAPLKGRDLACWCPLDSPCHADVLLELANP